MIRDLATRVLFVFGAGLLASHSSWAIAPPTAVCVCVGIAILAVWAIPPHSKEATSRLAIVGTAAALGWAGPPAIGFSAASGPFFAQTPGELPLLFARAGLLLALVIATEAYSAKARASWLGLGAVLLVASLCCRILFWPYCCVSMLAIGQAARRARRVPSKQENALGWAGLALAVGATLLPPVHRKVAPEPSGPAEAVEYWMRRANPYQARYRALEWAKREVTPGEGYLALARVDIALAMPEKARKALTKLVARAESDDMRRRAQSLLDVLDRPAAPGNAP